MRRSLFILFCIVVALVYGGIDAKIKSSKKRLYRTTKKVKGLNVKLTKIAKDIKRLQQELKTLDKKLVKLDTLLQKMNEEYKQKLQEYESIKKSIKTLTKKEITLREQLVLLISNAFSKSLLLTSINRPTQEDILKEEILKAVQRNANIKLRQVGKIYNATKRALQHKQKRLARLEKEMKELLSKQKQLKQLKSTKATKLAQLDTQQKRYKKELKKLLQQQASLRRTLHRLKILKQSQKRAAASSKMRVKKYGEKSYKGLRTVHYKGKKTIPPLEKFVIVKRYGVYKDPIYKIEIPNENIELKPLTPNAKVRNVLNGKVILAKWTPHLKNVVIIKHPNGLYTIYANLDKIAPFVKKGRRIKKGYTIGRVKSKLIFEVTKNNANINPLELIRVN